MNGVSAQRDTPPGRALLRGLGIVLLLAALPARVAVAQETTALWPHAWPAAFAHLAYPAKALDTRQTGVVVVKAATDDSGRVTGAEVLSGADVFAAAVLENVKTWTLSPGSHGGVVVYRFEIRQGLCHDDTRSLFRLDQPNLVVVTACTRPYSRLALAEASQERFGVASAVARRSPSRYPGTARTKKATGVVVLDLTVDGQGNAAVRPLTHLPFLTDAAVADVLRWRFDPKMRRRGLYVYAFSLASHDCPRTDAAVLSFVAPDYVELVGCAP